MDHKLLMEDHRRNSKKIALAALIFAAILLVSCPPPTPPGPDPDPTPTPTPVPNILAVGDFNTLAVAGNEDPYGIWSDGTTMWVADTEDNKLYAYNLRSKEREPDKDFETLEAAGNTDPTGIWGNVDTMWVADTEDNQLYAYTRESKERDAAKDFDTLITAGNEASRGIWFGGATMWAADETDNKLYAYNLRTRMHTPGTPDNTDPPGNTLPDPPENLRFTARSRQVELMWEAVTGVASYRIYRDGAEMPLADITETSYTDTGLTNGDTYTYTVRSVWSVGDTDFESNVDNPEVTATLVPSLPGPINLRVTILVYADSQFDAISLGWAPPEGVIVNSYSVFRDGIHLENISTQNFYIDSNNIIRDNIVRGTTYTYTVRALQEQDNGNGNFESPDSMPIIAELPTLPPTELMAMPGDSTVTLTWNSVSHARNYHVYRNGAEMPIVIDHPTTTYTDTDVTNGATYIYIVKSSGMNGVESREEELDDLENPEVTAKPPTLPPGNLSATPGDSQVMLSWKMVAGATNYHVYRDGSATPLAVVSTLTHTDTGLINGTTYNYIVRSSGSNGVESSDSRVISAFLTPTEFNSVNNTPAGIWSDGTTMWVMNATGKKIFAYNLMSKEPTPTEDFGTLHSLNSNPRGIWSNGTTMWVTDISAGRIFAYHMNSKTHDRSQDFDTNSTKDAEDNTNPNGIWSDGITTWVADDTAGARKIFAYNEETTSRDLGKDFDTLDAAGNRAARGIWSNGTTMWVMDATDDKLFAYNMETKERDGPKDISLVSENAAAYGIWSNQSSTISFEDATMWVSDWDDDKIYAYDLSTGARIR